MEDAAERGAELLGGSRARRAGSRGRRARCSASSTPAGRDRPFVAEPRGEQADELLVLGAPAHRFSGDADGRSPPDAWCSVRSDGRGERLAAARPGQLLGPPLDDRRRADALLPVEDQPVGPARTRRSSRSCWTARTSAAEAKQPAPTTPATQGRPRGGVERRGPRARALRAARRPGSGRGRASAPRSGAWAAMPRPYGAAAQATLRERAARLKNVSRRLRRGSRGGSRRQAR